MKSLIKYFKYIPKVISFLWSKDRLYVISVCLESIFLAIAPFPSIYLVKYTVDMMSEDVDLSYYVLIVTLLLFSILVISILKSFFNAKLSRSRIFVLSSKLANEFYAKSMNCKYEYLFENEFLNKRELAKMFTQGGLSRLAGDIINLISLTITTILSINLLASVDIITIFIILGAVFIESRLTLKKVQFIREINNSINIDNRKYNYFSNASCDQKYFKDIKLFNLSTLLNNAVNNCFGSIFALTNKNHNYNNKYTVKYNLTELLMTFSIYVLISINILYFNKSIGYVVIALNVINLFKRTLVMVSSQFGNYIDNVNCMEYYIDYMKIDEEDRSSVSFIGNKNTSYAKDYTDILTIDKIEFRNVSFIYPGQNNYALENINTVIYPQDSIALIGLNGAGKTTFLKLLMRFYDVTSGEILVNNINIKNYERKSYMALISSIFQDFMIFSFTIKENINSLSCDENDKLIDLTLKKSGLENKIDSLPNGINIYINKIFDKDGIELSGGEQQKLAFARAIYKQSAKIIVFDEPTASLDPVSEYNLYKMYNDVITNNISFFVSHRLSCVNLCNKIMMFENGKLTAFGSHNELYNTNEEYRNMYNIQSKSYK